MTNTHRIGYLTLLLIGFVGLGMTSVSASEVTGTLSSDASVSSGAVDGNLAGTVTNATQADGSLSGTVSSGRSGGGSSGGRRSSGSSDDASPDGIVLGATTDTVSAPSFPNAGVDPARSTPTPTLWSRIVTFVLGSVSLRR